MSQTGFCQGLKQLITLISISVMIALSLVPQIVGQSDERIVEASGLVVDKNGHPLSGVLASLIPPPCEDCVDSVHIGYETKEDGVFFLEGTFLLGQELIILIEGPIPNDLWNPIDPAYLTLSPFPEYSGRKYVVKDDENSISFRETRPHIEYGTVVLFLAFPFDYARELTPGNPGIKLSLEHAGKAVREKLTVAERDFDRNTNSVRFALPLGQWKIGLEYSNGGQIMQKEVKVDLTSRHRVACFKIM